MKKAIFAAILSFESALSKVEEATKGDDVEAITTSVSKLYEAASPVFAKKQEAEQASKAPESNSSDQPIDAEFTEV